MPEQKEHFYAYWGKAGKGDDEQGYHLLVYHCLDVAAVAKAWWQSSASIRRQFCEQAGLPESQTEAWLLFFIALHDLGKFDIRFQLKAKEVWQQVNVDADDFAPYFSRQQIKDYWHGPAGVYWLYKDWGDRFANEDSDEFFLFDDDNESWLSWFSWLAPVAGHHGSLACDSDKDNHRFELVGGQVSDQGLMLLKKARQQYLEALATLFLKPAGLALDNDPPLLADGILLAGFCSVCDWLGSSSDKDCFEFDGQPTEDLQHWFESRLPIAENQLLRAGITGYQSCNNPTVQSLLKTGFQPRQVQYLVEQLPRANSLTLIEASTGSGKTEAALAHAWQLLEQNLADSIVFALPTQATANAMLSRIENAASVIFEGQVNAVLAHGRARFQQDFINLQQAANSQPAQGEQEARLQCARWLAESKKRVFLGQIGICTVDQVLVSVLPVRHKFVRGFGMGRSVLIIDEVHAYDAYMYGLLDAVLKQQRAAGGSAILLSATLPDYQKQQLMTAWAGKLMPSQFEKPAKAPYPLITGYASNRQQHYVLHPEQQPPSTTVNIELKTVSEMLPDNDLLEQMIQAAEKGAQVCLVCNLVDVAQQTLQQLQEKAKGRLNDDQLILFHSRFIFTDRQQKEEKVIGLFGPKGKRQQGHILVSTQVFECSIDADMDWMISQLCPVDLLFQRWGRLHRHKRSRPNGFEQPLCTVLVPPETEDYELHGLIYGDSRILWRTQQLLMKSVGVAEFPSAYRQWIEPVYAEENWGDEPDWVLESHQSFENHQLEQRSAARLLINSGINELHDTDSNVSAVTRDGEMSLTLVPVIPGAGGKRCLLDGAVIDELDDSNRFEKISLNNLGVPASWNRDKSEGQLPDVDENGVVWLDMKPEGQGVRGQWGDTTYSYSSEAGLQRKRLRGIPAGAGNM
ncbi:CRISPR-associated helicase/endonuclease Cas3 [Endozoicomonadaceae bacterium StTr2]